MCTGKPRRKVLDMIHEVGKVTGYKSSIQKEGVLMLAAIK